MGCCVCTKDEQSIKADLFVCGECTVALSRMNREEVQQSVRGLVDKGLTTEAEFVSVCFLGTKTLPSQDSGPKLLRRNSNNNPKPKLLRRT
jgi:hypothetical protein